MRHYTSLRLLIPSSTPLLLYKPSLSLLSKPKHRPFFTVLASNSDPPPRQRRQRFAPPQRRRISGLRDKKAPPMEDPNPSVEFGFNKRRAEGSDKSDASKKNLQLKVRKLNPINTLAYVQVLSIHDKNEWLKWIFFWESLGKKSLLHSIAFMRNHSLHERLIPTAKWLVSNAVSEYIEERWVAFWSIFLFLLRFSDQLLLLSNKE